jgi:hypothetical protein
MALQFLFGLGRFFNFLVFYTVGRTPWTGDQLVARSLPARRTARTQNKRTQTSIPQMGFEPTIPVSERAKTVRASAWSALPLEMFIPFATNAHRNRVKMWFITSTLCSYIAQCRLIDGGWMWKDLKGVSRDLNYVWPRFLFADTERNSKNRSQHNQCLSWDSNLVPLEYKSRAVLRDQPVRYTTVNLNLFSTR